MTKYLLAAGTAAMLSFAFNPAMAQESSQAANGDDKPFDGPYIGGSFGYTAQPNDTGESVVFDTDLDGNFDDTVTTTSGADAFSPGFCNGAARGNSPSGGCANDDDDIEYFLRAGYDRQYGNIVIGGLVEGGRSEASDSVTAFSTTPASYTFSREADYTIGARLRAGYAPGDILFYATGGGAYARLDNRFATTNGANAFTDNGKTNAWGWSAGGGTEAKVAQNLSIGLEYLYTSLSDDDYTVNAGPGTAPATNPFLLGAGSTDLRRSDDDLNTHSIRATALLRF